MTIYKIRAWVNKRNTRKGQHYGNISHEYQFEKIIIDNLDYAKEIFKEEKNKVANMHTYKGIHSVKAELFIPKIHENGELAHYPEDEETYIEIYNPDNL